jgi:glutaredoxin 2
MTLFTKEGCEKCDYLKEKFDLNGLRINVEVLSKENADALSHLAWHELVSVAEKTLPILVLDDSSYIAGVLPIKRYLEDLINGKETSNII